MTLANSLRGLKGSLETKKQELFGTLGVMIDGRPIVNVPTRNGYVYVKIFDNPSELIQAKNTKVPATSGYGTSVLLAFDGVSYTVTGLDTKVVGDWGSHTSFPVDHAPQHMFTEGGGADPIFLDSRQFIPLSVAPTGTWGADSVYINRATYMRSDGTFHSFGGTGTPSLYGYSPTDDTAVMLLIYCDTDTGNPGYILGDTYFDVEITDPADIVQYLPTLTGTSTNLPLAAIRLTSGTSSYLWSDVYDMRQFSSLGGDGNPLYLKLDASNGPITAGLGIEGSSNEVQLYLKLDSAQLENGFEIRDSNGNVLSGADERGVLFSNAGTSIRNTFIGDGAGNTASTGIQNTTIGYLAGSSLTTGNNNLFFGDAAGIKTENGNNNMVLGGNSLVNNVSGGDNTAIGVNVLTLATGVNGSVGIGSGALTASTTGDRNIAIGQNVLSRNTTGSNNVSIGASSMFWSVNGHSNVVIGYLAGLGASTKSYDRCVLLGTSSGQALTTGDDCIFIGYGAGSKQTTNQDLFILDNRSRADIATESTNALLYGVMASTPASQTLRINAVATVSQNLIVGIADSAKAYFGAGQDMSVYYDGTDGYIKINEVAASDLHITTGAAKTLELDTEVWDDQQVSLGAVGFGASAPDWVSYKGGKVLGFDKAQNNEITFIAQITHKYKVNEDIEFHIHLAYPDGNSGNTRWTLTYSWANITGQFPTETSVSATIASPAEIDNHQVAEIAATISAAGADQGGISSVLICSLTRDGSDAADTYDNDVYMVALDFHVPLNTIGSRQEASK